MQTRTNKIASALNNSQGGIYSMHARHPQCLLALIRAQPLFGGLKKQSIKLTKSTWNETECHCAKSVRVIESQNVVRSTTRHLPAALRGQKTREKLRQTRYRIQPQQQQQRHAARPAFHNTTADETHWNAVLASLAVRLQQHVALVKCCLSQKNIAHILPRQLPPSHPPTPSSLPAPS